MLGRKDLDYQLMEDSQDDNIQGSVEYYCQPKATMFSAHGSLANTVVLSYAVACLVALGGSSGAGVTMYGEQAPPAPTDEKPA